MVAIRRSEVKEERNWKIITHSQSLSIPESLRLFEMTQAIPRGAFIIHA
jgi:hypothetical protein